MVRSSNRSSNRSSPRVLRASAVQHVEPKKPRIPNPKVLAVLTTSLADKDLILASDATKYFTEPHYNGFPAVLVRLDAVTAADLGPLLEDAWRKVAPKELLRQRD